MDQLSYVHIVEGHVDKFLLCEGSLCTNVRVVYWRDFSFGLDRDVKRHIKA